METLVIKTRNEHRQENNTIYVEFYPQNIGFGSISHGADLPIVTTIQQAIDDYEPTAREAIREAISLNYGITLE